MVAVIDYDAGNLGSVVKALEAIGGEVEVTRNPAVIKAAGHVVLPGVGAYADAYSKLKSYNLTDVVKEAANSGKPFLGICLGMQILFDYSEESFDGEVCEKNEMGFPVGLGILPGCIRRIPPTDGIKVPHMGWNSLELRPGAKLFEGLGESPYVYFVHSYYLQAAVDSDVAAVTEYGVRIHAAVEHGNVFGCQFHPEKSGDVGLAILNNFLKCKRV